jgi:hypothetical protein
MSVRITLATLALAAQTLNGLAAPAGPFTPCYGKYFLAAGSGEQGHKDGYFLDADFNQPAGMALSKDQNNIYVADSGNHDLRAIALDKQNQVSTVLGDGIPGLVDGMGSAARLSWPTQVVAEADGSSLWLLDQGNSALRLMDLKTLSLRTLESPTAGVTFTSMVGDPKGGIYFVQKDKLFHKASPDAPDVLLGEDPNFGCPDGHLLLLERVAYFANPCSGFFYRVDNHSKLAQLGYLCLTKTASAFCPILDGGRWQILYWSPNEASVKRFDPLDNGCYSFPMTDYQGTLLPGPSPSLVGINATSDFRVLLKNNLQVISGPGGIFYFSEACSGRIIGVDGQLMVPNDADANNVRQQEPGKPANTIRLDVVGASLTWFWQQYGTEKTFNQNLAFIRELERNLNLESALHGQGKRYEVLAQVNQLGVMFGSPPTYFLEVGDRIKNHQVDQVLICVDHQSLNRELGNFLFNRTVDDLGVLPPQADWEGMTGPERYKQLGPITRGLIDWIKAHPDESRDWAYFDGIGRLWFKGNTPLAIPRLQQFILDILRKAFQRDQALAAKYGATVAVAILPARDVVEIGEKGGDDFYDHINGAWLDKQLFDLVTSMGMPCYDVVDPMRLVALGAYPLFVPADSHYMPRGHGWMASMVAREMTGSIPSIPPDRSQP